MDAIHFHFTLTSSSLMHTHWKKEYTELFLRILEQKNHFVLNLTVCNNLLMFIKYVGMGFFQCFCFHSVTLLSYVSIRQTKENTELTYSPQLQLKKQKPNIAIRLGKYHISCSDTIAKEPYFT